MHLDQTHAAYEAYRTKYLRSADLYEGNERVENGGYLTRHSLERDSQFAIRKERATYRNYAAPIVDVFSAAICENRPAAILPEALQPVALDVDRQGNARTTFFQDVVRLSAAHGARFVLVDAPKNGAQTLPYFVQIDALNVIDWQIGGDGSLDWVVLKECKECERLPFEPFKSVTGYTLWTRDEWQHFEKDGDGEAVQVDGNRHHLGRVPLIPFLFETQGKMVGVSAIDEVMTLLIRIFRRDSELDKQLFDSAVAVLFMAGFSKEEVENFVKSSWNAFYTTSPDARMEYVETSGASFKALIQSLDRDLAAVREIALRQVRPLSGVGESAEAKRLDRRQLDCQLAKFARQCQNAEEQCWKMAAAWLRLGEAEIQKISTPYNDNLNADGIDTMLTDAFLRLHSQKIISRKTVLSSPAIRKILPDNYDPEEDAKHIAREGQPDAAEQNEMDSGVPAQ